MSLEALTRIVCSGIYSLVLMGVIFFRYDDERDSQNMGSGSRRYTPYISGSVLPGCLLVMAVTATILAGAAQAARLTLSMCFGIFLHISLYYMVLLTSLPLLRRYISARACAMLWMIPNYLYLTIHGAMELPGPGLVIFAPEKLVWVLFTVWLVGMIVVLLWKMAEHLVFRRRVLADSAPVTDPEILAVWEKCLQDARFQNPKFRLVTSPEVKTPLSIGLFFRTIRVILPERSYRGEELELILRHELVHIGREDAWSKFFLMFCTAMCWFNPLMWMAMGKSAEDIELSCDETVLLGADEDTRRRYAQLLLDTAGDERGFTTCLSASARAMRHRLKSVTKPGKRRGGAIAVGLVFFLLCITCGYTALAYDSATGAERIWSNGDPGQYSLGTIYQQEDTYATTYEVVDEQAFFQYLSELTLYELTGNYSFSDTGRRFNYHLNGPEYGLMISLCDNAVKVTAFKTIKNHTTTWYYLPEGVDWEYLSQIIVARPAMNVDLYRETEEYARQYRARLTQVSKTVDEQQTVLYEEQEEYGSGVFSSEPFREAVCSFSQEPVEPCSVLIESWDRSQSYTVTQTDLTQPFSIVLPEEPAHYIVSANFRDQDGALCQAQFRFDIGDV